METRRFGARKCSSPLGLGELATARLRTWPPTARPICASSPAAWMAVVTSSVPLGGELVDSGAGSAVRARSVDSASEGAPARTGRGPCAGRGAGAGFGFAAAPASRPRAASASPWWRSPTCRSRSFAAPRRTASSGWRAGCRGRFPLPSSRSSLYQSTFRARPLGAPQFQGLVKRGRNRIERLDSGPS